MCGNVSVPRRPNDVDARGVSINREYFVFAVGGKTKLMGRFAAILMFATMQTGCASAPHRVAIAAQQGPNGTDGAVQVDSGARCGTGVRSAIPHRHIVMQHQLYNAEWCKEDAGFCYSACGGPGQQTCDDEPVVR